MLRAIVVKDDRIFVTKRATFTDHTNCWRKSALPFAVTVTLVYFGPWTKSYGVNYTL